MKIASEKEESTMLGMLVFSIAAALLLLFVIAIITTVIALIIQIVVWYIHRNDHKMPNDEKLLGVDYSSQDNNKKRTELP
jgi:hypothetical protein